MNVEFLEVAKRAAYRAGESIMQSLTQIDDACFAQSVEQKSAQDYVSHVDRQAETIIKQALLSEFPQHAILAEESGLSGAKDSEYLWVIDPLDGTTNFLFGLPHFAVSIALLYRNEPIVGVVYDPSKNELFSAEHGKGACINDKAISVRQRDGFKGALIATGIPFNGENLRRVDRFSAMMEAVLGEQTSGIRRLGSAALDLAYVACGRYDGFWEANLQKWDIAAGCLLVAEAGGRVSDFVGEATQLNNGNIVAGSPHVYERLQSLAKRHYAD